MTGEAFADELADECELCGGVAGPDDPQGRAWMDKIGGGVAHLECIEDELDAQGDDDG